MGFDFGALERLWLTPIEEAISSIELRLGERLYAIAFWLFYAETGAIIHQPMVGLGVETAPGEARFQTAYQDATRAEGRDAGFASLPWNPADWEYDILVPVPRRRHRGGVHGACDRSVRDGSGRGTARRE